jgi:LPS O-antigen subunit length determinant protein (WzzB/FepE family)
MFGTGQSILISRSSPDRNSCSPSMAGPWAQQIKRETEAKVQALQEKATQAHGKAKENIKARIDQLRKRYEDSAAKLRDVTAEKLREAAVRVQKAG